MKIVWAAYLVFFLGLQFSWGQTGVDSLLYNDFCEPLKTGESPYYYGLKNAKNEVDIYSFDGVLFSKQVVKKGKKDGECIWYHDNGAVSQKGAFRKGKPIGQHDYYDISGFHLRSEIYNKRGKVLAEFFQTDSQKRVYSICDRLSYFGDYNRPIKAQKALGSFIADNLVKPAVVNDIADPVVVVDFLINPKGALEEVEIIYSADIRLNQSVLDLMDKMPPWSPAEHEGENVYSQMSISISF